MKTSFVDSPAFLPLTLIFLFVAGMAALIYFTEKADDKIKAEGKAECEQMIDSGVQASWDNHQCLFMINGKIYSK